MNNNKCIPIRADHQNIIVLKEIVLPKVVVRERLVCWLFSRRINVMFCNTINHLIFLMCLPTLNLASYFRPGEEATLLVGIFSNCNANGTLSWQDSPDVQKAQVCKQSLEWVFNNKEFVANNTETWYRQQYKLYNYFRYYRNMRHWDVDDFEFVSFQVCVYEDLLRIMIEIFLSPKFHVSDRYEKPPKWWGGTITDWRRTSRISAIISYVDVTMMQGFFPMFMVPNEIAFVVMNDRWDVPEQHFQFSMFRWYHTNKLVRNNGVARFVQIETLLEKKKVKFFNVLLLEKDDEVLEWLAKKGTDYCYSIERIQLLNVRETTQTLQKLGPDAQFIAVFGNGEDQIRLFNLAVAGGFGTNSTWVLYDIESIFKKIHTVPRTAEVYNTLCMFKDEDIYYLERLQKRSMIEHHISKQLTRSLTISQYDVIKTLRTCSRQGHRIFIAFMRSLDKNAWNTYLPDFHGFLNIMASYIESVMGRNRGIVKGEKNPKMVDEIIVKKLLDITCPTPKCKKGWEKYHGIVTLKQHKNWNFTVGWSCRKCEGNRYKPLEGDGECLSCPFLMKANRKKDGCEDLYHLTYNNISKTNVQVCVAISACGCVLTVFTFAVFYFSKESMLVRSLDFRSVAFHLLVIFTAFIVYPILFFTKPVEAKCIARPLVINILNCSNVSVMYAKSNRIVMVFNSKLRMTSSQIKKMNVFNLASTLLFVLIGMCIAVVSIIQYPVETILTLQDSDFSKTASCNTGFHNNLQIFYMLLLQILPSVQAFRGRNLPGPFNEALCIVYMTFISIVSYTVMVPIFYFQHSEAQKEIVQFFVLITTNLVQVVLLYGKKTYTILFQKHKNTKQCMRNQLQGSIIRQ